MTQYELGEYLKGAVFPQNVEHIYGNVTSLGLTKREYFAAMAMQGLLSGPRESYIHLASESVMIADALIKALNEIHP